MKKFKLLGIAITAVMFISSCGGSRTNIDGGVLGELPSIAGKTVDKLDGLVKDLEKANQKGDSEKYTKLIEEIETIKEEAKTEMNTYIQTKEVFTLPFEQKLNNEKYTIKEIKLIPKSHFHSKGSLKSTLVLQVTCIIVEKSKCDPSMFLRFVNSDKEVLEGYATLNYFGKSLINMEPDTEIVFEGAYTGNVQDLVKVEKMSNMSREDWNELRKKQYRE